MHAVLCALVELVRVIVDCLWLLPPVEMWTVICVPLEHIIFFHLLLAVNMFHSSVHKTAMFCVKRECCLYFIYLGLFLLHSVLTLISLVFGVRFTADDSCFY